MGYRQIVRQLALFALSQFRFQFPDTGFGCDAGFLLAVGAGFGVG